MYGQSVGSYIIQSPLGQGGMGMVYLAQHQLLGRPAAVKVLLPEFSRNTEIVNRFFNEARAATTVRHPGIVEIYDFGFLADGCAYIVMEFLEGQGLAARIAARGRMPALEALSIARQIAGALAAAHGKGIVHRDLKPDNVFLVRDPEMPSGERIKLLDFGIAKLAGEHGPNAQKTRTGAVMGTPTYMAPEQCRGVAVDHRADLYALGCILFEMLCGRAPFVGEGAGDVLAAHIHVPPPLPREFAPELSPGVEAFVLKLLAKDPAQRPQTADAVIAAIDEVTSGAARMSGAAPVVRPVTGASVPTSPRMPSSPAASAADKPTTLGGAAGSTLTTTRKRGLGVPLAIAGVVVVGAVIAFVAFGGGGGGGADTKAAAAVPASTPPPDPAPKPAPKQVPAPVPPPVTPAPAPAPAPKLAPATHVQLTIESTPPGADVLVDGKVVGTTPYHAEHDPSPTPLAVVIRLAGYREMPVTVDGTSNQDVDETLEKNVEPKTKAKPKSTTKKKTSNGQSENPFG